MKICSRCKAVAENGACPICQRRKYLVEPKEDDLILLTDANYVSSFLIEDILNNAGIKFLKKGALGSAVTVYIGELSETYNFYVMAKDYEEAISVIPIFELDADFEENEV